MYFLLNLSNITYLVFAERFNKKCKNLTANKHEPIASLSNALVRDGTCRYFRWRRRANLCRTCKLPITEVCGVSKITDNVSPAVRIAMQGYLGCGCRLDQSSLRSYTTARIGGKHFTAGERLVVGVRCGSVVTRVTGGRSVYGLLRKLYRVLCQCNRYIDLGVFSWFPFPTYPDKDPLTIRIDLNGLNNINNIRGK